MIREKWYVSDALETLNSLLSVFTSTRKLNDLFKKRNLETKMVKKNLKPLRATVLERMLEVLPWHFPFKSEYTKFFLHIYRHGDSPSYRLVHTIIAELSFLEGVSQIFPANFHAPILTLLYDEIKTRGAFSSPSSPHFNYEVTRTMGSQLFFFPRQIFNLYNHTLGNS